MKYFSFIWLLLGFIALFFAVEACKTGNSRTKKINFQYQHFKDSIFSNKAANYDSSNFFDGKNFTPGVDSLNALLVNIDTLLHQEASQADQLDTLIKKLRKQEAYTEEDKEIVQENIRMLDSFLLNKVPETTNDCNGMDCFIYAAISKSAQKLYLYIAGELKDSFLVSTGIKRYETPDLNLSPRGPVLIKYKSKKYPGGNYKGLGNMPYAVFLRGGYAIHGTTPGNFAKLGTKASHGCVRLHPDNARLFNELVKIAGLSQTWVTIKDSIP